MTKLWLLRYAACGLDSFVSCTTRNSFLGQPHYYTLGLAYHIATYYCVVNSLVRFSYIRVKLKLVASSRYNIS